MTPIADVGDELPYAPEQSYVASLNWRLPLPELAPGGRLVLYTGAVMVDGGDPLFEALLPHLEACGLPWSYREMDPDVFGEELDEPAYADAERIAAVALIVQRLR